MNNPVCQQCNKVVEGYTLSVHMVFVNGVRERGADWVRLDCGCEFPPWTEYDYEWLDESTTAAWAFSAETGEVLLSWRDKHENADA